MMQTFSMSASKKGQVIGLRYAFFLVFLFVALGGILPFIQAEFQQTTQEGRVEGLNTAVSQKSGSLDSTSAIDVALSIVKMFFWTFGDLPLWLDLIFIAFRIQLLMIIIQYFPFVG